MVAKYIIYQVDVFGHVALHAVVFSQFFKHAQMLSPQIGVAVSAGFCTIDGDGVMVWGGSNGLGLTANFTDVGIIERQIKYQTIKQQEA